MKKIIFQAILLGWILFPNFLAAQNVGVNIANPAGKLHVKGSANVSQLMIDAFSPQSNANPLLRLRKSTGIDVLWITSDDSTNCFMGVSAGKSNVVGGGGGIGNSFFGNRAGIHNAQGHDNTAIGSIALYGNTRLSQNTAIGAGALGSQSYDPGFEVSTGNVAVGNAALFSNQPTSPANGVGNSALGWSALRFNTTGWNNTALGFSTLYSNTIGTHNVAVGSEALYFNTAAGNNIAIGFEALYTQSYTPGSAYSTSNIAVGYKALYSNQPSSVSNGVSNVAIGNSALGGNTTGYENTAVGNGSIAAVTTGYQNTACGKNALINNLGGNNNVAVGYNSGTAVGSPNTINTVSIGNGGYLNGANNQVFLGNLSSAWTGGNVTWSTYSDARVKNNIQEDVKGLDFINRLRPVTYSRSIQAMREITGNIDIEDYPGKYDIEKIKFSGFLAQEVHQAAEQSGYDFSGITIPKNDHELYTLSYEQFVVPLVKGMQEQQGMINELLVKIDLLANSNQELVKRIEELEKSISSKEDN